MCRWPLLVFPPAPPQESYDQHLLVCHNVSAISSVLSLLAEGSVISRKGTRRGDGLGCRRDSSESSGSGDSSGHEDGSPRASRLALQLCMVLATSAAGRKVGNIVWDPRSSHITCGDLQDLLTCEAGEDDEATKWRGRKDYPTHRRRPKLLGFPSPPLAVITTRDRSEAFGPFPPFGIALEPGRSSGDWIFPLPPLRTALSLLQALNDADAWLHLANGLVLPRLRALKEAAPLDVETHQGGDVATTCSDDDPPAAKRRR